MIVTVPIPLIVKVEPLTVAMFLLLELKVMGDVELDVTLKDTVVSTP